MTVLCAVDSIEYGSSRGFQLGDASCFVVKSHEGDIRVYANSCPHLGVELDWVADQFLDSEGRLIQCATHGALFLIDSGQCVAGPCLGQYLQAIPFTIEANAVVITTA